MSSREGELLLDFLRGRHQSVGVLDRVKSFLPQMFGASSLDLIRKQLTDIDVPMELHNLEACSGVIAVPRGDAWYVHTVAAGVPDEELILHGDLIQSLTEARLHVRLYKKIKKLIVKRRRTVDVIPYGEAVLINRMFWWAYFGSRHEDVRVYQVDDLPSLS